MLATLWASQKIKDFLDSNRLRRSAARPVTGPSRWPLRYLLSSSYLLLFGTIGLITSLLAYLALTRLLWMVGFLRLDERIHTVLQDVPSEVIAQDGPNPDPDHRIHRALGGPIRLPENFKTLEDIPVTRLSAPFSSAAVLDGEGRVVTHSPTFSLERSPVDPGKLARLRDNTRAYFETEANPSPGFDPRLYRLSWADRYDGQNLIAPLWQDGVVRGYIFLRSSRNPEHMLIERFLTSVALGLLVATLATITLSTVVARRWSRPLEVLAEAAHRVAGGDLTTRTHFDSLAAELHEVSATFDQMVERLQTQFATQQRFVADASHELKTPVAALEGQLHILELIEERAPDQRRGQALVAMERDLRRMERLVTDLLTLSKAEQPATKQETFSLPEMLHEAVDAASGVYPERTVVSNLSQAPAQIVGEVAALEGAVRNLLDNALKYSEPHAKVELLARLQGQHLRISIIDNGKGIGAQHLSHLGERFYRVDKGRARSDGGTGLGLSIVKAIAEKHGGRLEIESREGVGTTASLILPAALVLPRS